MKLLDLNRSFALKRAIDLLAASIGLLLFGWVIVIAWILATFDTGANGMFTQSRIGRFGRPFRIYKIRTMRQQSKSTLAVDMEANGLTSLSATNWTSVTRSNDNRITKLGRLWRKLKIDELPQMFNVFKGDMSLVGPRPDVPGFADALEGDDRLILTIRPGITGPATLKYRHEEELLTHVSDPEGYNRDVIFPDKVRINKEYVKNWTITKDLSYIAQTALQVFSRAKKDNQLNSKLDAK